MALRLTSLGTSREKYIRRREESKLIREGDASLSLFTEYTSYTRAPCPLTPAQEGSDTAI
jgi:hypothetical protein